MGLNKVTYVNKQTVITAQNLNDIQDSIIEAEKRLDDISSNNQNSTTANLPECIVNVKDFGAKGDGITNDKGAIIKAFDHALSRLPATVYFPKGIYMLYKDGIQVNMPNSTGGLTVRGDGSSHSIIKYADEWEHVGQWVALRITCDKIPGTYKELKTKPDNWDTDYGSYYYQDGTTPIYYLEKQDEFVWEPNKYYTKTVSDDGTLTYNLVSSQVEWEAGKYYVFYNQPVYKKIDTSSPKPEVSDWANNTTYFELEYDHSKFLNDITIKDLCIEDTNPVSHAAIKYKALTSWESVFAPGEVYSKSGEEYILVEQEPSDWSETYSNYYRQITEEETHGLDIQYCYRAKVLNCTIINVGDEGIDMHKCIDSLIDGNNLIGSPAIGASGGAISVGDGCDNIIISNNTVDSSHKLVYKRVFGIAVEALNTNLKNIIIKGNTISDMNGPGINISASSHGGNIDNVIVDSNIISDSYIGIVITGSKPKYNITVSSNNVHNVDTGLVVDAGVSLEGLVIGNFNISKCDKDGIRISSDGVKDVVIDSGVIKDINDRGIYCAAKNSKINNIIIDGVGLSKKCTEGAIRGTATAPLYVSNVNIINCYNTKGIDAAHTVVNTNIEQIETNSGISGEVQGTERQSIFAPTVVIGGCVNRRIHGVMDNAIIDGVTIVGKTYLGNHAITILGRKYVRIINCRIDLENNTQNKDAINESNYSDRTSSHNIFAHNIVNFPITKVSDTTKILSNIDLSGSTTNDDESHTNDDESQPSES